MQNELKLRCIVTNVEPQKIKKPLARLSLNVNAYQIMAQEQLLPLQELLQ